MSFRDNLQHLRATRNMTQEQLAMLLGVSRQSVTKWEAKKSYPEMDKLLKMCDLFGCTLDELVSGDLTYSEADVAVAMPSGPAADVCGYDETMRKFANNIALGVALIVAGVALCPAADFVFGEDSSIPAIPVFLGVAAGLAFIIPAAIERAGFAKEHPFVEDFYTAKDRQDDRAEFSRGLVIGIGAIMASFALLPLSDHESWEDLVLSGMMLLWAGGIWGIVRAALLHGRIDIINYNRENADDMSEQELDGMGLSAERREQLMQNRASRKREGAVCGIIMLVATLVGLGMLFFQGPESDFPFWYAWVAGGIACAIYTCAESILRER